MDQLITYIKDLFKPKEQSVLGVDIGSSSIKVVQLRKRRGKAVLETYGEISLGPYAGFEIGQATNLPPDKIAQALIDVMKESNVTTKNAGVAIPIKASLITVMELPSVDKKQLVDMIPLEARKYIPVPMSEVKLDWSLIPEDSQNASDIPEDAKAPEAVKAVSSPKLHALVVAIHNDTLQAYTDIVAQAGIQSSFFEIEIFSAIRSTLDQDVRPIVVIDMGASATKLYIIERGIVRNSHIINRGSQDITLAISRSMGVRIDRAEKLKRNFGANGEIDDKKITEISNLILDSVIAEARTVILNYQKHYNKNVVKIIMTGGGATLKGIVERAAGAFQIDTMYGSPFDKVEAPAFLSEVLRLTGREFAVAVGVALRKLQELE